MDAVAAPPRGTAILARDGCLVIAAPFDAAFVPDLKSAVPTRQRRWEPASRTWRIRAAGIRSALLIFSHHFPVGEVAYWRTTEAA